MKCHVEVLDSSANNEIILKFNNPPNMYLLQSWSENSFFANGQKRNIALISLLDFVNCVNSVNSTLYEDSYESTIAVTKIHGSSPFQTHNGLGVVTNFKTINGVVHFTIKTDKFYKGTPLEDILPTNESHLISISLDPLPFGYWNKGGLLTSNFPSLYPKPSDCYSFKNNYLLPALKDYQYAGGDAFFKNYSLNVDNVNIKSYRQRIYNRNTRRYENKIYSKLVINETSALVQYYQIWQKNTCAFNKKKRIQGEIPLVDFVNRINSDNYRSYINTGGIGCIDDYFYQPTTTLIINGIPYFGVITNFEVKNNITSITDTSTSIELIFYTSNMNFTPNPNMYQTLPNGTFNVDFKIDPNTIQPYYTLNRIQGIVFLGEPSGGDAVADATYGQDNTIQVINSNLGIGDGNGDWPDTRAALTTQTMVMLFQNDFKDSSENQVLVPYNLPLDPNDVSNSSIQFQNQDSIYTLPEEIPSSADFNDVYWVTEDLQNWLDSSLGIIGSFQCLAAIQTACYEVTPILQNNLNSLDVGSFTYSYHGIYYSEEDAEFVANTWNAQTGQDILLWWQDTNKMYSGSSNPITNSQSGINSQVMNTGPNAIPDARIKNIVSYQGQNYQVPPPVIDSVNKAGPVQNYYFFNTESPYSYTKCPLPDNPQGLVNDPDGNPCLVLDPSINWYRPIGPNANEHLAWHNTNDHVGGGQGTFNLGNAYSVFFNSSMVSNLPPPQDVYELGNIASYSTPNSWNGGVDPVGMVNDTLEHLQINDYPPENMADFANINNVPVSQLSSLTTPPSSFIGNTTNNPGWSMKRLSVPFLSTNNIVALTWTNQTKLFIPALLYNVNNNTSQNASKSPHYTKNMGALFYDPNFQPFQTLNDYYNYTNTSDSTRTYQSTIVKSPIYQPKPTQPLSKNSDNTNSAVKSSFFSDATSVLGVTKTMTSIAKDVFDIIA
jgi:hypothetical protein